MYILDYLVYGHPPAWQQRHVAVDSAEQNVGLEQPTPRQTTQTQYTCPYVLLYNPPAHKKSLPQAPASTPVSSEPASEPSQRASSPLYQKPQPHLGTSQEASVSVAIQSSDSTSPWTPRPQRENYTASPSAQPSNPLGLKDCRFRACAGVVDTFQKAMRKGAVGERNSTTDAAAAAATASAIATANTLAVKPAANETGTSQTSTAISTTARTPLSRSAHSPAPTPSGSSDSAAAAEAHQDGTSDSGIGRTGGGDAAAATAAAAASGNGNASAAVECPPDTWQIGRATWTFLHSVAAHYPDHPTPRQQELMRGLIDGLAEFYPCEVCAEHLREQVRANPPRVATARDLNLWLCGIHNEVNEMLGKPLFDCTRIAERWRDGPSDGSCD